MITWLVITKSMWWCLFLRIMISILDHRRLTARQSRSLEELWRRMRKMLRKPTKTKSRWSRWSSWWSWWESCLSFLFDTPSPFSESRESQTTTRHCNEPRTKSGNSHHHQKKYHNCDNHNAYNDVHNDNLMMMPIITLYQMSLPGHGQTLEGSFERRLRASAGQMPSRILLLLKQKDCGNVLNLLHVYG